VKGRLQLGFAAWGWQVSVPMLPQQPARDRREFCVPWRTESLPGGSCLAALGNWALPAGQRLDKPCEPSASGLSLRTNRSRGAGRGEPLLVGRRAWSALRKPLLLIQIETNTCTDIHTYCHALGWRGQATGAAVLGSLRRVRYPCCSAPHTHP
jgi:hypothetical protein